MIFADGKTGEFNWLIVKAERIISKSRERSP